MRPVFLLRKRGVEFLHAVRVVFRGDVVVDAAAVVDIVNFADAEDRNFSFDEHIHQHRARRLDRVIVAALGAPKISRRARERPGDHAAHFVRPVEHFPGNFAHAVQLGDGDHVFMRRDLEYAVARGVNDRETRSNVFLAQFLDDFGSGGGLVADRLAADGAFELLRSIRAENRACKRETPAAARCRPSPSAPSSCPCPGNAWRLCRSSPQDAPKASGGRAGRYSPVRGSQGSATPAGGI